MKPGEQVGGYKVERRIGRGAMGAVFLVTQASTGRRCALKLLNADQMDDPSALGRFEQEARSLVSLRGHPSIVGILDSGLTAEQEPYFVMEFVEGVTFRQALRGGAPLPELLESLEQIARALAHAHQLGFVHRDVKPENVLLGTDGVSRLTDFGIAASLYRTRNLTQTGSILGTLAYMAPEQANEQKGKVGPWSDAYSLGAMLYEALAGRPPLSGDSTMALLTKLLLLQSGEITAPSALKPGVDPRLEAVCMRALAIDPGERYRTLQEMADELARARPPVTPPRWASKHAAVTAGTSVSDEMGYVAMATERAQPAAAPPPDATAVDTHRRSGAGKLKGSLDATVDEDAGIPVGVTAGRAPTPDVDADDEDEEDEEAPEGGSRLLVGVVLVAAVSVALAGIGLGVMQLRRQQPPGPVTGPGAIDTGPLRALLLDGKWDEAIREGERLQEEHGKLPALEKLIAEAHQGQVQGAFRAEDTARARALLPEGWTQSFPELPWILALTGAPAEALGALPGDAPHEHRARIAAWAGDEAACRQALEKLSLDQGRALAWELSAFIPALRPEVSGKSLLPSEERADGWAAAARGEEALARGLVSVAAVAFDDAQRGEAEDAAKLTAFLGLARVELARGRLEQAAEQVGEAFRWVRHPLDQARCLGWSALIAAGLGADPEPLKAPTGGDVLARARRYAPGAPEVATALWDQQLLAGWVRERPAPLEGRDASPAWRALEELRAARRAGKGGALPAGEVSFTAAERAACERGDDGALGLLVGRACRLAALAEANGWRPGAQEAQQLLDRAARLRPASPALHLAQARAALQLRQQERALEAVERAALLSPGDPEVLLHKARVLRAGQERAAQELDLAQCRGKAPGELARELAAGLEPVLATWRAARDAAPAEHPLARAARVGAAWTLQERLRRLRQAGEAGSASVQAELEAELAPLLAGIDPQALGAARTRLVRAVEGGDARAIEQAEQSLSSVAGRVDAFTRQALFVGGMAGNGPQGEAWMALSGDLPGRGLLALRRAEAAAEATSHEAWLARAQRLVPDFPQVIVAEELRRGIGREPGSFLRLARALPRSSHLLSLMFGVLYYAERPELDELLKVLDAAKEDPAWVAPLARSLALRTHPLFPRDQTELTPGRLKELGVEHDRLSTRGALEATLALQAGAPGALPHLLRAMCQSSMALGSPRGLRCDPRVLPDVRFDLSCARAAAPLDPSVTLYWLHWAQERLGEAVDELLAMGFLANRDALLRHYQRDKVDEILRELNDLVPRDTSVEEVRRGVARLHKGERGPLLALALATLAAERVEAGGEDDDLPAPGGSALGVYPEETWHAQARTALALAHAGRPELLMQAGECALRALGEASPCGEALLPLPGTLLGAGVLPRLPADYPHRAALVPSTLPGLPTLGEVARRLRRPEDALDALTRAWSEQNPESLELSGSPCAPASLGFPRGLALLVAPQESTAQEGVVGWLLGAGRRDEALLGALRAGAFSRVEPAARVLHRIAREQVRPLALAREGEERLAALRLGLVLAREAKAVSRAPAGHGALLALLEVDMAVLGPAEEAPARVAWARSEAAAALEAKEVEIDPWLAAWALARACVAGDEPPPADALARLKEPSLARELGAQLRRDPLAAKLRADAALGPLLPE